MQNETPNNEHLAEAIRDAIKEGIVAGVAAALAKAGTATPELMDREEAAAYLKRPKKYLDEIACRGGGPHYCRQGRRVLYRKADLDAWLLQRRACNTGQHDQLEAGE